MSRSLCVKLPSVGNISCKKYLNDLFDTGDCRLLFWNALRAKIDVSTPDYPIQRMLAFEWLATPDMACRVYQYA
jgi:hypothetical protein